jgi:hypothetical protein
MFCSFLRTGVTDLIAQLHFHCQAMGRFNLPSTARQAGPLVISATGRFSLISARGIKSILGIGQIVCMGAFLSYHSD